MKRKSNFKKFKRKHINKNLKFKNVGTDTLVLLVYRENVDNLTININNYKLAPNEYGTI